MTYEFTTYWGIYHGKYELYLDSSDSLFDRIYFYDYDFVTKKAWHFSHISVSDTTIHQISNSTCVSIDSLSETFYVTMFDLTGDYVPFYHVCFSDEKNALIECCYNTEHIKTKQSIPLETKEIEMIGERKNGSTFFRNNYSHDEGSIAFIIGPPVERFLISKDRKEIKYRPCYCEKNGNCYVVFNRY